MGVLHTYRLSALRKTPYNTPTEDASRQTQGVLGVAHNPMHQKRALCSLALILVFSGSAFLVAPQKAHALVSCIPAISPVPDIPVAVPVQNVGAAIRQNISNTFQASNFTKECILDALVTFLKEALIQNLTGSIVDWINNDFEGGPAFVTDPAGFFVNIADETAGHFIETQLGPIGQLLCSPFDLQLRLNLWLSTSASRKQYIGCRLSEIEQSVTSAFTRGNFIASGGWRTWHAMTADPRNNQYGAFILASDALNTEFIKKTNERLRELSEGRGFLSYKKCTEWSEGPNEGTGEGGAKVCLKYKVETPGSLINNQLNNVFGSELRKFELADEINEIFQALVNAGLRQVFAKGGGLRSVGVRQEISKPRIIADSFEDVQKKAQGDARTNNAFNQGYNSSSVGDQTLEKVGAEENKKTDTSVPGGGAPTEQNIALNKTARQSSDYVSRGEGGFTFTQEARYAVDSVTSGTSAAETQNERYPWWEVDVGKSQNIGTVELYVGTTYPVTGCIVVSDTELPDAPASCTSQTLLITAPDKRNKITVVVNQTGRFVRVQHNGNTNLFLYEVKVYPTDSVTNPGGIPTQSAGFLVPVIQTNEVRARESTTQVLSFALRTGVSPGSVTLTLKQTPQGSTQEKTAALMQHFTSFVFSIKDQVPDTEIITDADKTSPAIEPSETAAPFKLYDFGTWAGGKSRTITYTFIPSVAARGSAYRLITEVRDGTGTVIPEGTQVISFSVPQ